MKAVRDFRNAISRQLDELETEIIEQLKSADLPCCATEDECCGVHKTPHTPQHDGQPNALHIDGVHLLGSFGDTGVVDWTEDKSSASTPRTARTWLEIEAVRSEFEAVRSEEDAPPIEGGLKNWIMLVEVLLGRSSPPVQIPIDARQSRVSDFLESVQLHLRPGWVMGGGCGGGRFDKQKLELNPHIRSSATLTGYSDSFAADGLQRHTFRAQLTGTIHQDDSCFSHLVLHPDSRRYMLWMLLGLFMVWYDVIQFPLVVFNVKESQLTIFMTWVTSVYWLVDIFMSCIIGFHQNSEIEMRPAKVFKHYLGTWFLADLAIVSIDYLFLLMTMLENSHGPAAGVVRFSRSLRGLRFLRVTRLFRLIKSCKQIAPVLIVASSDVMLVIGKLAIIVVSILVINHYVACGWFALAHNNHYDHMTWLKALGGESQSPSALYASSLHWSLTQFTPATNNIAPHNQRERWFAIFVVIFAMVMFSNFLSSLTNAFLQMKNLHSKKVKEEADLRHFLLSRKVSIALGRRIWQFYQDQYRKHTFHIHENNIPVLMHVPKSIKGALHMEIYVPAISSLPVCRMMARESLHNVLDLCAVALSERPYIFGGEIFDAASESTGMSFLVSGTAAYKDLIFDETTSVEAPEQIAETSLWTDGWRHCGRLVAASPCLLLFLDANKFEVASMSAKSLRSIQMYASLHIQIVLDSFQTNDPVTDIFTDSIKEKLSAVLVRSSKVLGDVARARGMLKKAWSKLLL